jgi:ribonuclease-3
MNALEKLLLHVSDLEGKLNYTFKDKHLLALAFSHRSFVNENRSIMQEHNERLEFLGDSVLGVVMAEYLYKHFPNTPEGRLSHLRSRLVEAPSCVNYIQSMDVECFLLLGKGEQMNGGKGRESILADLFEAVIGAIYLDSGVDAVKTFIFDNFAEHIGKIVKEPVRNWKAELQDYSQKKYQQTPLYSVIEETGPDHSKEFHVAVSINEKEVGTGTGYSKKEAQQAAAENALNKLGSNG